MKIAVSCGDVNGIGLEIFFKGLNNFKSNENIEFNLFINSNSLNFWMKHQNIHFETVGESIIIKDYKIKISELESSYLPEVGLISSKSGSLAALSLDKAIDSVISKDSDALLTLPISKEAMYASGWKFAGHTECLAYRCGISEPLMILFSDKIRAALATIHIPLSEVSRKINKELILNKIKALNNSLIKDFGINRPKTAILGLNPHAGENGTIGREENEYIHPAINEAVSLGIRCSGVFPSDGFFAHSGYKDFDAYLAMYHDQGLIPLKLLAAGGGVNFTAGLPIVRTSPDHGSALNIAGNDKANPQSFVDSVIAAVEIVRNRNKLKR